MYLILAPTRGTTHNNTSFPTRDLSITNRVEGFGMACRGSGTAFQRFGTAFQRFGTAFQRFGTAFQRFGTAFQRSGMAFQRSGMAFQRSGIGKIESYLRCVTDFELIHLAKVFECWGDFFGVEQDQCRN
jgi:hypothetical protein